MAERVSSRAGSRWRESFEYECFDMVILCDREDEVLARRVKELFLRTMTLQDGQGPKICVIADDLQTISSEFQRIEESLDRSVAHCYLVTKNFSSKYGRLQLDATLVSYLEEDSKNLIALYTEPRSNSGIKVSRFISRLYGIKLYRILGQISLESFDDDQVEALSTILLEKSKKSPKSLDYSELKKLENSLNDGLEVRNSLEDDYRLKYEIEKSKQKVKLAQEKQKKQDELHNLTKQGREEQIKYQRKKLQNQQEIRELNLQLSQNSTGGITLYRRQGQGSDTEEPSTDESMNTQSADDESSDGRAPDCRSPDDQSAETDVKLQNNHQHISSVEGPSDDLSPAADELLNNQLQDLTDNQSVGNQTRGHRLPDDQGQISQLSDNQIPDNWQNDLSDGLLQSVEELSLINEDGVPEAFSHVGYVAIHRSSLSGRNAPAVQVAAAADRNMNPGEKISTSQLVNAVADQNMSSGRNISTPPLAAANLNMNPGISERNTNVKMADSGSTLYVDSYHSKSN